MNGPAGNCSPVREPLWAALQRHREPVSEADLTHEIKAQAASVRFRLLSWQRAGFLKITWRAAPQNDWRKSYLMSDEYRGLTRPPALTVRGRPTKGLGSGRAAMWRAIRVLKRFTVADLVQATENSQVSIRQYVRSLCAAGILRQEIAPSRANHGRYALTAFFGPKPPVIREQRRPGGRTLEVFEPNGGTTHDITPKRASVVPFFDEER